MTANVPEIAPPAGRFRLRAGPLGAAFVLTLAVLAGSALIPGLVGIPAGTLREEIAQHTVLLLLSLAAIAVLKRRHPADYGLHAPRGRSYVRPAIAWGVGLGLLMLVVDHAPELLAHAKPVVSELPSTHVRAAGWLAYYGLYVGLTEEIAFRSMLTTYLCVTMPGAVRVGRRFEIRGGAVVAAVFFALSHATTFGERPWPVALGQQLYAFGTGVACGWWLERSGSVLAPAIGHGAADLVELALELLWAR